MIFKNFVINIPKKDFPWSYVSGYNSEDGPSFTEIDGTQPVPVMIQGTFICNPSASKDGIYAPHLCGIRFDVAELLYKLAVIDGKADYKISEHSVFTNNECYILIDREGE